MELWLAAVLGLALALIGGFLGFHIALLLDRQYRGALLISFMVVGVLAWRFPNVHFDFINPNGRLVPEHMEFRLDSGIGWTDCFIVIAGIAGIAFLLRHGSRPVNRVFPEVGIIETITDRRLTVEVVLQHCKREVHARLGPGEDADMLQKWLDGQFAFSDPLSDLSQRSRFLKVVGMFRVELKRMEDALQTLPREFQSVLDGVHAHIQAIDPIRS